MNKNNIFKSKKLSWFLLFILFLFLLPRVSFGAEGDLIWEKVVNLSGGEDAAFGMAVDSTGVYVAGSQNNSALWRVEKRSLADGSLIWEKAVNLSGGYDSASGIAVDSTGVYISGYQSNWSFWRIEKRSS